MRCRLPNKPSNLPERSAPWARDVEKEINLTQAHSITNAQELENAKNTISSLQALTQQQQNYIKTLCDLTGTPFPPVAAAITPSVDPPDKPTVQNKKMEIAASWSANWWQSFKQSDAEDVNSLLQRGSGYSFSMWGFNIGEAAGKKIIKAEIYLKNVSTYYNGAFTAILGTHSQATEPASRQSRQNGWNVGWTAGQGKWVALPAWMLGALSSGSIKGFTLGDTVAETKNYARFNGVGQNGAPRLRLTYQV